MDLTALIPDALVQAVSYAVPFLFVLTLVVFIHEMGHFLVARWCGVAVDAFSIGFGRELFGWNDRHGTRWKISLLPLGGYVKFRGDADESSRTDVEKVSRMSEEERRGSFALQPVWARAAIVAAGPIANFILALVIFTIVMGGWGREGLFPRVAALVDDSPAVAAGIQPGDVIKAVDGTPVATFTDIIRLVSPKAGETVSLVVERGGIERTLDLVPKRIDEQTRFGVQRRAIIGIQPSRDAADIVYQRFTPIEAVAEGANEIWFITTSTLNYLGKLVTGREYADQISGPLRVMQVSGAAAKVGFVQLLHLAGVISVSIGLLNLMPVPMLDGGHLVYYMYEALRGRPLSERLQEIGFRIGVTIVLALTVFATWNDIVHLIGLARRQFAG